MNTSIGKAIEDLMIKNNLNQKELAKKTGLTEASISNYISGKRKPNNSSLSKIAKVLNTTSEKILDNSKNFSDLASTATLLSVLGFGALSPLASLGGAIATGALL